MSDTTSNPLLDPQLMQLVQQLQPPQVTPQPASQPQGLLSRIGEALGGGALPGLSGADRETAGLRGLQQFGIGLMGGAHYGNTPFQALAEGFQSAGNSELRSAQLAAGTLASQQAYQQQQFTNKLEALKTAIPLLQQSRMAGMPNPLAGGGGGGAGGPGGGGGGGSLANIYGLPKAEFLQAVAQRESGGDPNAINYVAKADPTAVARGATASGKYQMVDSTWKTAANAAGIDTTKYPTARSAPEALQDQAASKLYDMSGTAPWDPSKWTKNWVQGSDGKYSLQTAPYTPPPGRTDTAAKPSTATPPTQAAGAPGHPAVQPSAPAPAPAPAAQPSIGDVALPPKPGSEANVVPGLTLDEATQVAAQRKQAVPYGTEGRVVQPDGTVIGGPPPGKQASIMDALQTGRQLAQAQPTPPGTVQAAGPAAGAGGAGSIGGAVEAPTPGLAKPSVIGTAPAAAPPPAPAPPTTAPAAPPAPQVTTQATQPPQGTQPQTFEQWQQQHPSAVTLPPAPTITVDPQALADAQKAKNAAAQQLQIARMSGNAEAGNKAAAAYDEASNRIATLQQQAAAKNADLQQQQASKQLELQHQMYDAEQTRIQQAQLKAQELAQTAAEAEKNRQADIRKAELAAGYTAAQKQADADIDIAKSDIQERAAESQKAGHIIPILQQMQSQFGHLPDGFIGGLLAKYDTTGDLTGILARMGVVDPSKATAAQMLIAARGFLSMETKPAATGSLRIPEMDKLQAFTPGQLQTPQAQQEMMARLIAYQKRIQDERVFAANYFGRPSDPTDPASKRIYDNRGLETAMNANPVYDQNGVVTGGGLGPVVPEPPALNAPDSAHQAYLNYIKRNVAPGMPYQVWAPKTKEDGSYELDSNGKPIPERQTKVMGVQ